ncbi:unnamed protein product, partial [Urochloa humidicola]
DPGEFSWPVGPAATPCVAALPPGRLGHPSVRVGGRHTLPAPACVCSPPFLPALASHSPRQPSPAPARAHPAGHSPSSVVSRRPPAAGDHPAGDQDPSRPRNINLGMVADTESSESLPGSSNAAAETPVHGSLDQRSQEKTPKKTHKAEREKLKRDQLNDLFLELGSMLDLDRQNTGKATVLGDAARVLRDLVTQVDSLRKEQSALISERQYVSSEKNELQEENATLKSQISELANELFARMGNSSLSLSSPGMSHTVPTTSSPDVVTHTHSMPHQTWSNIPNLNTVAMAHQRNAVAPLHSQHHSGNDVEVYAPQPQELQLFPGVTSSPERECSHLGSALTTSSSLTDSLPGQLCLSLTQSSQEESSSGALGSRIEWRADC